MAFFKSALSDGGDLTRLSPNVLGAWANDAVIRTLLHHMASPTGQAAHHEDRGEQFGGNAHEEISGGMEEICVTEQAAITGCIDDTCFNISVFCAEIPEIFGESQFCSSVYGSINLSTQSGYDQNGVGYQWQKDYLPAPSGTNSNMLYDYYTTSGTWIYDVTFTDNNGCTSTSPPFTVVVSDGPLPFSISPYTTLVQPPTK